MKLWRISQTENYDYNTYDSAVVAARTEAEARLILPGDDARFEDQGSWCSSPEEVQVDWLGSAAPGTKAGVILASFNAG